MWPNSFDYARAGSVDEALTLIGEDGKFLAGGHSLLPVMKLRLDSPAQLVDIGRINALRGISANGGLTIGATTTHDEIATLVSGTGDVRGIGERLRPGRGSRCAQFRHHRRKCRSC